MAYESSQAEAIRIGNAKDWHNPRNEDCAHNVSVHQDCNCKRPRTRKAYRVVRVHDDGVGHRVNPNLVMEIYPNGRLAFREERRRRRYWVNTSDIYAWRVRVEALAAVAAQRQRRKEARLARKRGR